MGRPRKNQLNDLNQVHGQLPPTPEELKASKPWNGARNLDEVMGRRVHSNYSQKNLIEYNQFLAKCDLADLRDEARRVGMLPSPDERQLKRNLIARFEEALIGFSPMTVKQSVDKRDLDPDLRRRMGNE